MQILVTSDGRYRPCSKHQDYISDNGRVLSVAQGDTFQDAWTSDYMDDIREHFLTDKKFAGCRECWRMQDMGLRSMRYDSIQYDGSTETQINAPIRPTRIEINASNVCNLKCRICYPNASTKWIKEANDLYGQTEKTYRNLTLDNLEMVREWSSSLEEVCFFGGEPLLSEDNLALMDHFILSGNAKRIALLFNTNGTVFTEELIDRLSHFRKVRMYFSIDDIGERFEYQRSGANWKEVEKNIERAYQLGHVKSPTNIEFRVCCTVSVMNVYYFPEFFSYFKEKFPQLQIFWNFLFDPWQLSIQLLPNDVKETIIARLEHLDPDFEMCEEDTKTICELVEFIRNPIDRSFEGFFEYINRHDVYRKESFATTFPELWSEISTYKPVDLVMGKYQREDEIIAQIRARADQYPFYSEFEELRRAQRSSFSSADIGLIIAGLQEISKTLDQHSEMEHKLNTIHHWNEGRVISENIVSDAIKMGLFKFYLAIKPLTNEEFELVMRRKYALGQPVS